MKYPNFAELKRVKPRLGYCKRWLTLEFHVVVRKGQNELRTRYVIRVEKDVISMRHVTHFEMTAVSILVGE